MKEKEKKQIIKDKIRGCIVGGAAGDALGYPVELMDNRELFGKYGGKGITEYTLTDGTALFSDDTQMTLFTANGILNYITAKEKNGDTKKLVKYIYHAYIDWVETQGFQNRYHKDRKKTTWLCDIPELYSLRAPGHTCVSALISGKMGKVDKPVNNSKGCGGIMRVAPFGLVSSFSAEEAFEEACNSAAITHGHPFGFFPAGVLSYIIHKIVFDNVELIDAINSCAKYMERFKSEYITDLIDWMKLAIEVSQNDCSDFENIEAFYSVGDGDNGGATGESALYIALYCALKYHNDFDKAIICAVNCGEDRDSTGGITGNLIGAMTGYNRIANKWKNNLELHDVLIEVADDLFVEFPKELLDDNCVFESDWKEKYINIKRSVSGGDFTEYPCGYVLSAIEQRNLRRAIKAQNDDEFDLYIEHTQNLPPRVRACIGYILNDFKVLEIPYRRIMNNSEKIEQTIELCSWSDIAYRINYDAFIGRKAILVYQDDDYNWGLDDVAFFAQSMETDSSGLIDFALWPDEYDRDMWRSITFRPYCDAIKDSLMIDGKQVSFLALGGFVLALNRYGEFNLYISEIYKGRIFRLEADSVSIK